MNLISDFFEPIDEDFLSFAKSLPQGSIGQLITSLTSIDALENTSNTLVIIGVPEDRNSKNNIGTGKNIHSIRKELYRLFVGNWNTQIVDLGDLIVGASVKDTEIIISEIISFLVRKKHLPIILGGSQSITYATYRAFDSLEQKVNLTIVDSKFDLGIVNQDIDSQSYLTKIVMEKPNNLFNFTNIGYQTFLNAQDEINLIDTLLFDAYRLGVVKNNLELVEPVLRDTDLLSIDIGVIRKIDAPANRNANISGLTADDICKITRYAGLSDKLSVLGIYEYNYTKDIDNQTAQVIAQMIWYYIEGVNYRSYEFPSIDLKNFKKYIVLIDEEEFCFYKSDKSGRWWMEINVKENNKTKRRTLIPCTYSDYLSANQQEIPDRWYVNRRKLS